MVKKHLKQLAAPKSWPLERKSSKYVTRPDAGAHAFKAGIPLSLALTNLVKVARTTAESQSALNKKEILVDQVRRKNSKFIIGFMDTLVFPDTKEAFRVLQTRKGILYASPIDMKEAAIKLVKISNKKVLGKDKIQLNLDSGRNIIVKKDDYKVGDTLLLELPSQTIKKHLKFEAGAMVLLLSVKHMGMTGEIVEVHERDVLIKSGEETFLTHKDTALVIGKGKPEINIPEIK